MTIEDGRRATRRFCWILAGLIFIAFWDVLLGVDTFAVRDFGLFSLPVASFHRQCFWNGELPWWNPLSCCGLPFLAQLNTLALYPLSLIYLLLPLTWALPFFCLLHLFLGGLGMYLLAARWTNSRLGAALAGAVFSFNGLALNFLMWPSHIAAFAWMPWVIYLAEAGCQEGGRKLIPAALAAAMQALSGGPEEILFTWLLLPIFGLTARRPGAARTGVSLRRVLTIGVVAFGLAAPALLPFFDFALHSNRDSHFGASDWSMPPWGWANFLVPRFQTWPWLGMSVQLDQYWTSSYYVGIGTVFLAAVAMWRRRGGRVWLLGGLVATALVLALGDQGFFYSWLRRLLPFVGFFRFPIKFVILTSLLFPLLAAYGVGCCEEEPERAGRLWRVEWVFGGAMAILIGVILWFARRYPVAGASWPSALGSGVSRLGFLAVVILTAYAMARRPAWRRWSGFILVGACWLDLITAVPWQNPTLDASVYEPRLGAMAAKLAPEPRLDQSRLMLSPPAARQIHYHPAKDLKTTYLLERETFLSDCNLLDGLPKVDGFFSLYLRESDRVLRLLDSSKPEELAGLEDFLGVSETIAPGKIFDWVPRTNYLPIVTIGEQPVFAEDATAFNAIGRTDFDFRRFVYLPPEAKGRVKARAQPAAHVIKTQFGMSRIGLEVETPGPAMVYLSQAYYHNWHAEVDGQETPLWRANYAFSAMEVPSGKHTVSLTYQDRMFWIGTILTIVSGLYCAALQRLGKSAQPSIRA